MAKKTARMTAAIMMPVELSGKKMNIVYRGNLPLNAVYIRVISDLHTMSMHRIGSSLSRLISALYLACLFKSSRIFFGLLHRESSFFQGPSSISRFKSCCDCCRTRDVLFRSFLESVLVIV